MDISLPNNLENILKAKVADGLFSSMEVYSLMQKLLAKQKVQLQIIIQSEVSIIYLLRLVLLRMSLIFQFQAVAWMMKMQIV